MMISHAMYPRTSDAVKLTILIFSPLFHSISVLSKRAERRDSFSSQNSGKSFEDSSLASHDQQNREEGRTHVESEDQAPRIDDGSLSYVRRRKERNLARTAVSQEAHISYRLDFQNTCDDQSKPDEQSEESYESQSELGGDTTTLIASKVDDYTCKICRKSFVRRSDMTVHMSTHIEDGSDENSEFQCDACSKRFTKRSQLLIHKVDHMKGKPFKCEVCSRGFEQKPNLRMHILTHYEDRPHQCNICQKGFKRLFTLNEHIKMHYENLFKCNVCPKRFFEESQLEKHKAIHKGDEPISFQCEICGKEFTKSGNLNTHIKTHSAQKPFKCDNCLKGFALELYLRRHQALNKCVKKSNEPITFKCEICCREFTKKGNLIIHIKTHSALKPFQCDICLRSFTLELYLKRHQAHKRCGLQKSGGNLESNAESPNQSAAAFTCNICGRRFKESIHLEQHVRLHESAKPYQHGCNICGKVFGRKSTLKFHMHSHSIVRPYQCGICLKRFKLPLYLKRHKGIKSCCPRGRLAYNQEIMQSENVFRCNVCPQQFTEEAQLEKHLQCHLQDKPKVHQTVRLFRYSCDICGKEFKEMKNLKVHRNIHREDKPFECDLCHRRFALIEYLKKHQKNACNRTEKAGSSSDACFRQFSLRQYQKELNAENACGLDHDDGSSAVDSEPNPNIQKETMNSLKCDVCGKEFHRRKNLQLHMKIHVKGKPYQCDICFRLFSLPQYLRKHKGKNACRPDYNKTHNEGNSVANDEPTQQTIQNADNDGSSAANDEPTQQTIQNANACGIDHDDGNCALSSEPSPSTQNENMNTLKCDVCSKEFHRRKNLQLHKKIHVRGKHYHCETCMRDFSLLQYFRKHKRKNSCGKEVQLAPVKLFQCDICLKRFAQRKHLTNHKIYECSQQLESTGPNPASKSENDTVTLHHCCEICEKQFTSQEDLKKHKQIHIDSKSFYVCDICGEGFAKRCTMTEHMSKHQSGRDQQSSNFDCDTCDKSFTKYSALHCHKIIHMKQGPYKCDICLKSFVKKNTLQSHLMTHYDDRPHKCTVCHKGFKRTYTLKEHMKVHCENLHKCSYCPKQYTERSQLELHMKTHRENLLIRYQCHVCSKCFTKKSNLKTHMKIHCSEKAYKCDICLKSYAVKEYFIRHLANNACKAKSPLVALEVTDITE